MDKTSINKTYGMHVCRGAPHHTEGRGGGGGGMRSVLGAEEESVEKAGLTS